MQQRLDLIVGLGNPGPEYLRTRHNAGFWFADLLARSAGATFTRNKKLLGETAEVTIADQRIRLLKPQTFMNRSGQSVAAATAYYKIAPEHVLVVYDELDLPPGRVKLKFGGGHAGHNGIGSLVEHIGTGFWRLRLGVGHPGPGRRDEVLGHVLKPATADEERDIMDAVTDAIAILPVLIEQGPERAKNRLHSPKSEPAEAEPDAEPSGPHPATPGRPSKE